MKNKRIYTAINKIVLPTVLACVAITACGNAKTQEATNDTKSAAVAKLDKASEASLKENLKKNLKASGYETEILNIRPTEMSGLFWVVSKDLPPFFTDKTGSFVIQGEVIKVGSKRPEDISASFKQADAVEQLSKIDSKEMIAFKPKGDVKGVVYVFTDVDCGYCRKLHSEMDEINAQGIEVRYLAWPRSPQTIPAMQNIWCADDKNVAMNTAKTGGKLEEKTCDNPIEKHVKLGQKLGVSGTPAIFNSKGVQIGGYLPAKQLAKAALQ